MGALAHLALLVLEVSEVEVDAVVIQPVGGLEQAHVCDQERQPWAPAAETIVPAWCMLVFQC